MPPHGGHHGGHHGGGGRGIPPFYYGGYGGPWYDPAVEIFTVDQGPCPDTRQPVVGSDGQVYQNACKARLAGVKPVKSAMSGFQVTVDDKDMTPGATIGFWAGVAAGALGLTLLRAVLR